MIISIYSRDSNKYSPYPIISQCIKNLYLLNISYYERDSSNENISKAYKRFSGDE